VLTSRVCFCNELKQIESLGTEEEYKTFKDNVIEYVVNRRLSQLPSNLSDDFTRTERVYKCSECAQIWGLEHQVQPESFAGNWRIIEEGKSFGTISYAINATASAELAYDKRVMAQVFITVVNTGETALFLEHSAYDLEDASGKIIAASPRVYGFPQIIQPGESGHYCNQIRIDGWSEVAPFKVIPHLNVFATHLDSICFEVSEIYFNSRGYNNKISNVLGRIENKTEKSYDRIYVAGLFYGKEDEPIGYISSRIFEEVPPGAKVGFSDFVISLTRPDISDVSRYEVFAFLRQLRNE